MGIVLLLNGGAKAPVKFETITYGPRVYLGIAHAETGNRLVHLGSGSIADMVIALRCAADELTAQATRDEADKIIQAALTGLTLPYAGGEFAADDLPEVIEPGGGAPLTMADLRLPNPYSGVLSRADAEHNIRVLATRFPWLYARDVDRRQAEKIAEAVLKEEAAPGPGQLEADLQTIAPHLSEVWLGKRVNKSALARILGISPGGPANWERLQKLAEALEKAA